MSLSVEVKSYCRELSYVLKSLTEVVSHQTDTTVRAVSFSLSFVFTRDLLS